MLERLPQIRDIPKAGGLSGQILELLRYRGELERFEAASTALRPASGRFPWGGMHVDFTRLSDPPMQALPLPQPKLEGILDELARELGADIRRGHEVIGLSQDNTTVTADVRGPNRPDRLTAGYLVGCDGANSRVRDLAGIPFPGITYPEVQRLAAVTVPESVTVLGNGDIDVAGVGRIPFGFTRTERGEFALGSTDPSVLGSASDGRVDAVILNARGSVIVQQEIRLFDPDADIVPFKVQAGRGEPADGILDGHIASGREYWLLVANDLTANPQPGLWTQIPSLNRTLWRFDAAALATIRVCFADGELRWQRGAVR